MSLIRNQLKAAGRFAVLPCVLFLAGAALAADRDVIAEGTFTKMEYRIAGSWSLIEEEGEHFVVLDDEFSTKRGPDLKIFLSPLPLSETSGRNATQDSLRVAELKSHKGTQRYRVPAGTDLDAYKSILIHCEKYSKLWGGGTLAE